MIWLSVGYQACEHMFNSLRKASTFSQLQPPLSIPSPPLFSVDFELLMSNSKSMEGICFNLTFAKGADEHPLYRPSTFNSNIQPPTLELQRERGRDRWIR